MTRFFPTLKLTAALAAVVLAVVIILIWRSSVPPKVPEGWPPGSIWVKEPGMRLSFIPKGVWEGCWLDVQHRVDRCKFGDHQGRIFYQSDYLTCDERPAVPDERLWLMPSTSVFIYLRDGTMLIERSLCEAHNRARNGNNDFRK